MEVIVPLDQAITILLAKREELAHGSLEIWRKVNHAVAYLEKQVKAELEA